MIFQIRYKVVLLSILLNVLLLINQSANGQVKVNITTANPALWHACSSAEWIEVTLRNITTSSVNSIVAKIDLPVGMVYLPDSLKGGAVTQKSISNLNIPEFTIPDLKVFKSITFSVKVKANCDILPFIGKGGIPLAEIGVSYVGGSTKFKTLPFKINQPALRIASISNQYVTKDLKSYLVREIKIMNTGKGRVDSLFLEQTNQNGLDVYSVKGGTIIQSGTTIKHSIFSSNFQKIGNKNTSLDENETFTIVDSIKIVKCNNLSSTFRLTWGCNKTCFVSSKTGLVTISNKAPKLIFKPKNYNNTCYDINTPNKQELLIVNKGNFKAISPNIDIFQSYSNGFYKNILSKIDTSSFRYSIGKNGTKTKVSIGFIDFGISTGKLACLGNKSIARVVVLMPDIEVGDSIYLTWNSLSCCPSTCGQYHFMHRWKFTAIFQDQCQRYLRQNETWGSTGHYQNVSLKAFAKTDVNDGDTVNFIAAVTNATFIPPSSSSKFTVMVVLPKGLKMNLTKNDVFFETHQNQKWNPNTVLRSNDTVFATFLGKPKITLRRADLKIVLIGNCNSKTINSIERYEVLFNYLPDKSCSSGCEFKLYCYKGSIKTHCGKACSGGLKVNNFSLKRVSYGLPDNNNDGLADATGKVNLSKIRTERIMHGDTFRISMSGKINNAGSTSSWAYLTAESSFSYGKYFEVVDVNLKIFRSGGLIFNCNNLTNTFTTVGSRRTFKFDLGVNNLSRTGCRIHSTYRFTNKDSVELIVNYRVKINPKYLFIEGKVVNYFYLHTVARPSSSQKFQCDTFSGNYMLAGWYFTSYGKGVYPKSSCDAFLTSQNYYLSIGNCCSNYAGGNLFPFEYRNWAKPSKIILIKPEGFDLKGATLYDYRTSGTGKIKRRVKTNFTPFYTNKDTAVYDLESLFKDSTGTFELHDDGFYGLFYPKFKPNCKAKNGANYVRYGFVFRKTNFLGGGLDTLFVPATDDIINYEKPKLEITHFDQNIDAKSDTATWIIKLKNSSPTSDALNIWFAGGKNGNSKIIEVKDLDNKVSIKPIYDIFRLGTMNRTKSRNYEIRAIFTGCNSDSIPIYVGYNCDGFPDSLSVAECVDVTDQLNYTPVNTRLEATILSLADTINLCESSIHEVIIKNQSEAKSYQIYLDLFLRNGMVLGDTAWLFTPTSTDSFAITNSKVVRNTATRLLISDASILLNKNGLAGNNSANNWVKIKYSITTNCDFVSSTYYLLRPGGNLNCGTPVLSSYAFSPSINIKGVRKPYFSDIQIKMNKLDACNYDGKGTITFLNLGPDTTGANDKIQLLLPKGIYIDTNYIVKVHNGPSKPKEIKGKSYLGEWLMPSGIQLADSIVFKFRTYLVPSEIECDEVQIGIQSVVDQPAFCVSTKKYCSIKVATSSNILLDSIKKGIYSFDRMEGVSTPVLNGEKARLTYEIFNSGSDKFAGNLLLVKVVDDVNNNGVIDLGDSIVAIDSIRKAFNQNETLARTIQFLIQGNTACRLFLVVDSNECVCSPSFVKVPALRVLNAGRDTLACSGVNIDIGLASKGGHTYRWFPNLGFSNPDSSWTIMNYNNLGNIDSSFTIYLETDRKLCKSIDTVIITLRPALRFNLDDTMPLCIGNSILIGESPQGGTGFNTYKWTPPDSLIRDNRSKTFANPIKSTSYKIVITDAKGCSKADSSYVKVIELPKVNFSFADTCSKEDYIFTNITSSINGIDSIAWSIDNKFETNSYDLYTKIDSTLPVKIKLYVKDDFGCWDTLTKSTSAFALPTASFTTKNNCLGDSSYVLNTSSLSNGAFTSKWNIDGNILNTNDAAYLFTTWGNKIITLTVQSNKGCKSIYKDSMVVNELPALTIYGQDTCYGKSNSINFSALFNSKDTLKSHRWILENGNSYKNDSLIYSFPKDGTHKIKLAGESNNNCVDTAEFSLEVHPLPLANFTYADTCFGEEVKLVNASSIKKGAIQKNEWSISSGFTINSISYKYTSAKYGPQNIGLAVTSDKGCVDTIFREFKVAYNETANISTLGHCQNDEIQFSHSPLQPDSIKKVYWYHNSTILDSTKLMRKIFSTYGLQKMHIQIVSKSGCVTDSSFTSNIDAKPIADFDFSIPCQDDSAAFVNISKPIEGTLIVNKWVFGDGETSNSINTGHRYLSKGNKNVSLEITNTAGCKDTITKSISTNESVVPFFIAQDICVGDTQLILERSSKRVLPVNSINFSMGNGENVKRDSFFYTYNSSGNYAIKMDFTTNIGCKYSFSKPIQIYPLPKAGFTMSPRITDVISGKTTITDAAIGATKFQYSISDGSQYNQASFTHRFADTGVFTIVQKIENQFGCKAEFSDEMVVLFVFNFLIPNAFSPNNDGINDSFKPDGLGIDAYYMEVYSRWGEKIFDSAKNEAWAGEDALPGVYMYNLKIVDFGGAFHYYSGILHLMK